MGLLLLPIPAGAQIGEQIMQILALQIISEGRHKLAAVENLVLHLILLQPPAHAGEIRPFVAAGIANCVAVRAAACRKDRGAMLPLAARGGEASGREGEQHGQHGPSQLHCAPVPPATEGSEVRSLCVCHGTLSEVISGCLRRNSNA